MSKMRNIVCPKCHSDIEIYDNPAPVVDIIIEIGERFLLIERKFEPHGWAIPGGFVDYGETVEAAAVREAKEETSLDVELLHLLGVYSDPARDDRQHTISTTFVARASGTPKAADDAKSYGLYTADSFPNPLVFDHDIILNDYFKWKKSVN